MRQAAAEVGRLIRSEDGIGASVEVIERLAASPEPVGVQLRPAR
jgi:hypothetical protein